MHEYTDSGRAAGAPPPPNQGCMEGGEGKSGNRAKCMASDHTLFFSGNAGTHSPKAALSASLYAELEHHLGVGVPTVVSAFLLRWLCEGSEHASVQSCLEGSQGSRNLMWGPGTHGETPVPSVDVV